MELAHLGYALASALYAGLAIGLGGAAARARRRPTWQALSFIGAIGVSALWAGAGFVNVLTHDQAARLGAAVLDIVRYGLWLAWLLSLLWSGPASPSRKLKALAGIAAADVAAALVVVPPFVGILDMRASFALALSLPVLGLLLVEQVYRAGGEEGRWGSKPFCIALGLLFVFDIYLYSEAALFGRLDQDAVDIRGGIHAASVPLLLIAQRRHAALVSTLQVSRAVALHTVTLVLVGAYLLFISAVGYYIREFGGHWGHALQLGLLFIGAAVLAVILLSGSVRARLKVLIGKHFFRYRFDYRAEWLRFTSRLSSASEPRQVDVQIVQGLADMVESPSGALWSLRLGSDDFVQTGTWNMPRSAATESVDSSLATFLRTLGWIISLDECAAFPERYRGLTVSPWLRELPHAWLVVPLPAAGALIGFVVLAQPRTPVQLNWEVRDLLKTASRQAASFLAQMHATEELLEARKFDAFNRMSAFVVHDLKNIVTQLSLLLKNARRLHDNPEFQRDMLSTVENSLDKMRQLILQLREGETPSGVTPGVDLVGVLTRLVQAASQNGRSVELQVMDKLATRGHSERIERVVGHLLQNALDATPVDGRVWLRLQRAGGHARVVVGDTGEGMSPDFVHTRLFRPFNTTKTGGLGIGAFESFQYVKELGGNIEVDSEVGRGTLVTIQLPVFETHQKSDLPMVSAK